MDTHKYPLETTNGTEYVKGRLGRISRISDQFRDFFISGRFVARESLYWLPLDVNGNLLDPFPTAKEIQRAARGILDSYRSRYVAKVEPSGQGYLISKSRAFASFPTRLQTYFKNNGITDRFAQKEIYLRLSQEELDHILYSKRIPWAKHVYDWDSLKVGEIVCINGYSHRKVRSSLTIWQKWQPVTIRAHVFTGQDPGTVYVFRYA